MKRQLWKAFLASLGAVVVLLLASSVQAQEMFLISYPNANITVDGDSSDWNLDQFGTIVVGGVAPDGDALEWERVEGTGDIAHLGWDDGEQNVFYGGMWTAAVLPEDRADNTVKFYTRDNATHQYFLVDVTDDEINTGDEAAWANDAVEFYIDPGNDAGGSADWSSDVQLVIDASNQAQVWNSPDDYKEQVEAGVSSVITVTETGWLLEVGIDKNVFDPPLPAVLGPANDPAGNNYGIDLSYRDNDDPEGTGTRNGDTAFTTDYIWADPNSGGGFPSKAPDNWGQMIAGEPTVVGDFNMNGMLDSPDIDLLTAESAGGQNPAEFDLNADALVNGADVEVWAYDLKNTWIGDANVDGLFNSTDLVQALAAGKFDIDVDAVWTEGDFTGDGRFQSGDLVAALADGGFDAGLRPATAAVPEPTSTVLVTIAALCGLPLWRRKTR